MLDTYCKLNTEYWLLARRVLVWMDIRPVSIPRLSLLRFVDSSFPGNSLWTWDFHPEIHNLSTEIGRTKACSFQSCTSKGMGRQGVGSVGSFCQRFLGSATRLCRPMPLLVHFWSCERTQGYFHMQCRAVWCSELLMSLSVSAAAAAAAAAVVVVVTLNHDHNCQVVVSISSSRMFWVWREKLGQLLCRDLPGAKIAGCLHRSGFTHGRFPSCGRFSKVHVVNFSSRP